MNVSTSVTVEVLTVSPGIQVQQVHDSTIRKKLQSKCIYKAHLKTTKFNKSAAHETKVYIVKQKGPYALYTQTFIHTHKAVTQQQNYKRHKYGF